MSTCIDCGQIHRTGLDGIRCDLKHHGEPYTRQRLHDLGLTDQQIDGLIDEAGRRTDDGFVNGGYMVRGLNDLATTADPTPQTDTNLSDSGSL